MYVADVNQGASSSAHVTGFERFAAFIVRHRRPILLLAVLATVASLFFGIKLFSTVQTGGYNDSSSQSARVDKLLQAKFGTLTPSAVLTVTTASPVDSPQAASLAAGVVARLQKVPNVASVFSSWNAGHLVDLRGTDGRTGVIIVTARTGISADQRATLAESVLAAAAVPTKGAVVRPTGIDVVNTVLNRQVESDLSTAEMVSVPLTALLLLAVFGALLMAGMPFVVAAVAVAGAFAALWIASLFTPISNFSANLVTGLGRGLGIDYALLIVNRMRDELADGAEVDDAVVRTVITAGRTVFFSGITVSIVLASLLLFPQFFLRSLGIAGVATTLLAMLGALVVLPVLLATIGTRLNSFRIFHPRPEPSGDGMWAGIARVVIAHRVVAAIGASVLLLVLSIPAWGAVFAQPDLRVLPAKNTVVTATEFLQSVDPATSPSSIDVIIGGSKGTISTTRNAATSPSATAIGARLSMLAHVDSVITPTTVYVTGKATGPNRYFGTWTRGTADHLRVVTSLPFASPQAAALVASIHSVVAGANGTIGGQAADAVDSQGALGAKGVWALLWVVLSVLVLLFVFTGSVLMPIKALFMNALSIGASIGVLVWVFQEGHLRWLIGDFTVTGTVDSSTVILIAIVAFALSTDYELFLVSRIKEEYDISGDCDDSVIKGLGRSGRIISLAAILLALALAAFVTSDVTSVKEFGFGVAVAIILDAAVVRGILVPSLMSLAGRWNWWAPSPARALHSVVGLRHHHHHHHLRPH